jgi:multidrug efflux pump subunit AcrB
VDFYRRFVQNHPLANIAFAVVLLLGISAYLTMPREQDPEINFNWVSITAVLPGASPQDIERLVTKPLEDAIKTVPDVRFSMSSSRESVVTLLVRFRDIDERTFDKRINDLRREIQTRANAELPPEAKEPQILEITTSNGFPTAMVVVTGQAADETLFDRARQLRDDLERLPGIDNVFATGLPDRELSVRFDPAALASRGLAPTDLADGVGAWFQDTFAGKLEAGAGADSRAWLVRVEGQVPDPEYLATRTVAPAARPRQQVPIDDVALVQNDRVRAGSGTLHEGRRAVLLAITKKSYVNTLDLVSRVDAFVGERSKLLTSSGVSARLLDDQTIPTREAIGVMERNALQGLLLVLAICWVFLGTRMALLVALGIPFALAGTFAILNAAGFTLNISVLLGVVIALGMLVDDVVVVIEAIYYRLQRGADVVAATLDSLREVFAPVTASVATTLAAFLPLMLLPGIVGKFMFVIPFVVTLALTISLLEAYWMMPSHVIALNPDFNKPTRMSAWRWRFLHGLRVKYARALLAAFRRPLLTTAIIVALVAGGVAAVASGAVRVQFFAFDPLRLFYVNVDMPAGTPLEATLAKTVELEERVRRHLRPGEVRGVASYAGVKFTDTEPLYGESYGQVVVSLNPRSDEVREVEAVVAALRADAEALPPPGRVNFTLLSGGPPLSKPVKVRVRGDDVTELRAAADALTEIVRAVPGTRDVADDDVPGRPELTLRVDRAAVRAAGVSPAFVARAIRLHSDGEIVAIMRDRGEKVEVRVRAQYEGPEGRNIGPDIARLLEQPVALPSGGTTTIGALAQAETAVGRGVIKHYNLRRAITVEADLDKEITDTVAANRQIAEAWRGVAARFPATDIDFSGELDDIQESLDAMAQLFLLGVGLIYLILAAQFRSYWQPFLILVTVPLAFTGVAIGLLVSRNPISLYTLYGVIALTGIAVNSAIVLIDAANSRRADGMSVLHATVYAARRRLVPILMTTTTTIGGLISLALGLGGKSLLWGPVASAIVWGLGVSTAMTLFAVPLLYWASLRRGGWTPRLRRRQLTARR